jgi:hypothetical protein
MQRGLAFAILDLSSNVNTPAKQSSETNWISPLPEVSVSRAAQTGVFDLDIRISNRPFIDVYTSCAAETGLTSRNVENGITAV